MNAWQFKFQCPFFSYVRLIQNHPPTPVRNRKNLAIPPTPLALNNMKMVPSYDLLVRMFLDSHKQSLFKYF